jgi:hypothetical protein
MKNMMIAGVLLIAIGIVSLLYQGITYTSHKNVINLGPISATANEDKTIPIPPIIGGLMLAGGVALLLASRRNA